MRVRQTKDRRPLLIAAVFALLFASGVHLWPAVHTQICPSILVVSSNEKYQLMKELARDYSSKHPWAWSGCGPKVEVDRVASGVAEDRLRKGWTGNRQPDVWAPAANTWVLLLKYHLARDHTYNLVPDLEYPSIAKSPLVVAMPKPMAAAIGWPKVKPRWKDLFQFAQDPKGWSRFGQPAWGAFHLGKTDPGKSTSGLHSMIATYFAATGKLTDLTTRDLEVQATHDFAAAVEKSVSHYAPTVGDFLDILAGADDPTGYISALAVEEQEVVNYNNGGHNDPGEFPKVPLTAVYPADGTLLADHPFVVLQAPWVTEAKRRTATAFMDWLRASAQQRQFQEKGFRDHEGAAGSSLQTEEGISAGRPNFLNPPDQEVIAAIQEKWQEVRKPAKILILLALADGSQLQYVKAGVAALSSKDEVAVWALAPDKKLKKLDVTGLSVGSKEVLLAVGSAPTGRGPVPLYTTIRDAHRFLKANADPERINAIVVIVANLDDNLGTRLIDLQREVFSARTEATGTPVRIYAVTLEGSSREALLKIEKASGGVASSSEDPADAIQIALANF
jgi:Ca-activated chloride channel family protein